MKFLYHIIVHVLLLVATPYVFVRCIFGRRYRKEILMRLLGIKEVPKNFGGIWIHASSVGEVRAGALLRKTLIEAGHRCILSTFTETGYKLAKKEGLEPTFRLPPDSLLWMNSLVKKLNPSAFVMMEAELWPALLWECRIRGVPTILANGRMSSKSYKRYSRFRRFFCSFAGSIMVFSMKSKKDAKRVRELGVLPEKIHVTGNVKFDTSSLNHIDDKNKSQLNSVFMIVFGSTRPGDEGTILRAFKKLLDDFPNLRCILAPRHMERIQEVEELIRSFGLSFVKQSELTVGEMTTPIILLDTVGDLIDYYKRSSLAFVGGSFNPRFGGHNILEPAACGKMVIYGKHMNNFEEESHLLTESGGGIQLTSPEDLYPTLHQLLDNPEELIKRGQSAFQTVLVNRGAVEKNKALIESFLL